MSSEYPIVLALGSNVEPDLHLVQAVAALREVVEVLGASSVYQGPPVGADGAPDFLNAALCIDTKLGPRTLKFGVLQPLERRFGRRRTRNPNAPRTLDIDLALFGRRVEDALDLRLPDPDLMVHPHVLVPVVEVAPEARHPVTGTRLAEIELDDSLSVRGDLSLQIPRDQM